MKWYSTHPHPDKLCFIIEDGGNVGFYLYVYESMDLFNEDIHDAAYCSRHQQDHLQDTLEIAKEQALEDFGVPLNSWIQAG